MKSRQLWRMWFNGQGGKNDKAGGQGGKKAVMKKPASSSALKQLSSIKPGRRESPACFAQPDTLRVTW